MRSAHAERPLNPARDEITVDGYFAGKAGIAMMVYQKSLNRVIKVPFQACEFHESDFIRPLPTRNEARSIDTSHGQRKIYTTERDNETIKSVADRTDK